ncbi:MAG: type I secretion system permease/ATPase [Hyphomonadaceae bacterium]|nr:type I secretion system permease/ATPase [Hyphomonadaceae bacterium]
MRAGRGIVFWALVFGAGVALLYLAPSLFMMQVYDRVLTTGGLTTLYLLGGALLVALLTLAFLDELRARLMARLSLRLDKLVAPLILQASLRRDARVSDQRARQALRDFDQMRQTLAGQPALAVLDAPWAPLYIAVCALIHPWLGGLVAAGAAVLGLAALRNEVAMRRTLDEASDAIPRFYAAQEADFANAEPVRALGMQRVLIDRQLARRADIHALQARSTTTSLRYAAITKFLRLALQSSVLGLGAYLAIEGAISPGALIAASIISSRALAPVEQIVGAWRQLRQARNTFRHIAEMLATAPPETERMALPTPRGDIRVERVSLRAPAGDRFLIHDVAFTMAPGETLAVVGPSGAGKSTLARIVAGAVRPDLGAVRLDMANYSDWEPDALGRHVGYLPQDVGLLEGTVAENISRFTAIAAGPRGDVDAATVAAATEAGAHDMILRLPAGYNTMLGPGGRGVSMGQAQRIGLARALYGGPPLLVLDEPNAHLDAEGEAALIGAVKRARDRGAAIMIVAHRAGVIAAADRLLVLRDGRVEAIGPREEITRRLAAAQPGGNLTPMRTREAH